MATTVTVSIVSGVSASWLDPQRSTAPSAGQRRETGTFVLELELCDDGSPQLCVFRPLTITVDSQIISPVPDPDA